MLFWLRSDIWTVFIVAVYLVLQYKSVNCIIYFVYVQKVRQYLYLRPLSIVIYRKFNTNNYKLMFPF